DAPRVPWEIEVEQVRAVRLEVEPFPSGIRCQEDTQGFHLGVGVEAALDLLAAGPGRKAIDDLDAFLRTIRTFNGLLQDILQIALRPLTVFGEDQHPALVPERW